MIKTLNTHNMIKTLNTHNMIKTLNTHNIIMFKKQFSTITYLQSDIDRSQLKGTKLRSLFSRLQELKDEREALKDDLDNVTEAVNAASKISTGKTPSQEENECLSDLQENYPTFFDSEGEQEGSSSLLNKIMGVKGYLRKELRANKKSYYKLKTQIDQEQAAIEQELSTDQPLYDTNKAESSKGKGKEKAAATEQELPTDQPLYDTNKAESSKRKVDALSDSEESSSSKKSRLSPSDYIDSLPYNPFDDIGTD